MKPLTSKNDRRLRRARQTRIKCRLLDKHRLTIFRTPRHMYAQISTPGGEKILAAASTVTPELRTLLDGKYPGNVEAAKLVGKAIAEKALAVGIQEVAFDRAGYRYHGRVKALADAAREHGLKF